MRVAVALNAAALALVIARLLWWARRPTEAVRLRNALVLQPSSAHDFIWSPPAYPRGYHAEQRPAGPAFQAIVSQLAIGSQDDWKAALALANHLVEHAGDRGAVQDDPLTTYRKIRQGYGYCADFVKVYLALAHAGGLSARQWAFSFDEFGGHGHTVVEVYDRTRRRWLMLDVFNNFHVVDAGDGEPLGVLEYREALLGRRGNAIMRPNGPGRPGFVHTHKAVDYYRRGLDHWYLVWGNAVLSYYEHPVVKATGQVSKLLAHFAANMLALQPRIRLLPTATNAASIRRMFALRRRLLALLAMAAALVLALAYQLLQAGTHAST